MKVYIICCVPAQILYLEKIEFFRHDQNFRRQSDCTMIKSTISSERIDEMTFFEMNFFAY